jgi:hypothetical protein
MLCPCGYIGDPLTYNGHIIANWHFPACGTCKKPFSSLERLFIHQDDADHYAVVIADGVAFLCHDCGLFCSDAAHLHRHQAPNGHPQSRSAENPRKIQTRSRSECFGCDNTFHCAGDLRLHLKERPIATSNPGFRSNSGQRMCPSRCRRHNITHIPLPLDH